MKEIIVKSKKSNKIYLGEVLMKDIIIVRNKEKIVGIIQYDGLRWCVNFICSSPNKYNDLFDATQEFKSECKFYVLE